MYREYLILFSFCALLNSYQCEFKKRNLKIRTTKPVIFKSENIKPSLEYLERSIQVNKIKTDPQETLDEKHNFNIEHLDSIGQGIIRTNSTRFFQNSTNNFNVEPEDEIGNNIIKTKKTVKQHRKNILPGYEGFHNVINHDNEAFEHNSTSDSMDHKSKEKPADLSDYFEWLVKEGKSSKLIRFRQLQKEIISLETKTYFDTRRNKIVENSVSQLLSSKVAKIIKELEQEESKQQRRFDL